MSDPLVVSGLFLALGLLIGALAAWLISKFYWQSKAVLPQEVEARYVLREIHDALQTQADILRADLQERELEVRTLHGDLSARTQDLKNLETKLEEQKADLINLQEKARLEFESVANRLLEEKSQRFTAHNQEQMQQLLQPLRERIQSFETGIEKRFVEETRDRVSLKMEIENLRVLNQQLSLDANNLASALKGDNKTQGDWGELQLETLLEKAGLQKDIHYATQQSYTNEEGRRQRPDFIIHLPEDKHLIIDAKVSLSAYERYCQANDNGEKAPHLRAHLDSLRRHIKELGEKNYQQLYQINTPDYLLLFVPIEPAFALAIQSDHKLFTEALERNIVLVTTSTLLATMRTVSFIWKQEKQKNSVLEIARQSGLLYDKFCNFIEDLQAIGSRLDQAQHAYHDAMNKLVDSKKYGDTLVGRAERIRELGAKTSRSLPRDLLDAAAEED
ncbi:MAG: DNA recombination protein RmuC [Lewinellaceae bacterium]|nr:DNA recombination protein RmuC [Lewinellaceae bacterium]